MILTYLKRAEWFVGLMLLQVLVLNNVHVAGYATPFIYIYFLLKLNSSVSRNELMVWGFCLGLSIDLFSNTPGMNAAACVLLAFVRPFILRLFSPRDNQDSIEPGFRSMGFWPFVRYVVAGTFLHHAMLLFIESFSFFNFPLLLLKIISSALLTILCILAIEGIRR